MKGGTLQINWHDTKPVLILDFHSPTGLLATGGSDHDIMLWIISPVDQQKKVRTASYKCSLSYHTSAVNCLCFSPSGEQLASGADDTTLFYISRGDIIVWKLLLMGDDAAWKVLKTLAFHQKNVMDLQWSPDGSFLISGSMDNSCIVWDVCKGSVHQLLDSHLHYVHGVAWDPLGHFVASLSSDRSCKI